MTPVQDNTDGTRMRTEFSENARRRLASDRFRPLYHFLPPANWMNDPNGLMTWKGTYHLFYQHNPEQAVWGKIHWGHARSNDLMHWTDLPLALAPTPGSHDRDGVWTGCGVDDNGTPTLVYTGRYGEKESVCLATSLDDLVTWEKHPDNPIISTAPEGLDLHAFRDPFIWSEGNQRYLVIGGGEVEKGGVALLYRAKDMHHWEYVGPLLASGSVDYGSAWECPNVFRFGEKHALIFSEMGQGRAVYFAGTFNGMHLISEASGEVD